MGTITYEARPIAEEIYYFQNCEDFNTPVLVRGKILRVEATVTPTTNDPDTTVDTISLRYVVVSINNKGSVLEDPVIYPATVPDPLNPPRADVFLVTDRGAAVDELGLRLGEVSI